MKELIEFVVRGLVNDPSAVSVVEAVSDDKIVIELKVAKEDVGKIIGKRGRTARAIRTILNAVSTKQGKRAELEIIE